MSFPTIMHGKRKPTERELEHIRIYGHEEGTRENPKWLVEHHHVGEHEPEQHSFDNGDEMLAHIADHAGVAVED